MSDELPEGFDAFCKGCGDPYTYANAQAASIRAEDWQHFCCSYCERHPIKLPRGCGAYCLSLLRRMRDENGIKRPNGPGKNRLPFIIGKGLAGWDFTNDLYVLTKKGRELLRILEQQNEESTNGQSAAGDEGGNAETKRPGEDHV